MSEGPYRIGVDIGGTFTDCVVSDAAGERTVSKALIDHEALAEGVVGALGVAATELQLDLAQLLGDTVEAVAVDGEQLIRCGVCRTRLAGYGEDYKLGTVMRERSFTDLAPLNAVAPAMGLVAQEFYCPGCGTAVALDIQAAGAPVLPECTFHPRAEGATT